MTSASTPALPYSSPAAGFALRLLFFCTGCLSATWGVQIPTVRDMFSLSPMQVSWLILALTGGAVAGSLFASRWIARHGPVRVVALAGLLLAALLSSVLMAPNLFTLLALLLTFGIITAFYDIALNLMASTREASLARPLISGLHAMFSLGGTIGAVSGALTATAGYGAGIHVGAMTLLCAALVLIAGWQLQGERGSAPPAAGATAPEAPTGAGAGAGTPVSAAEASRSARTMLHLMCWAALMALFCESAMYDWTALYIRDHVQPGGSASSIGSIGFGALTAGLMVGRFGGDRVRAWLGDARVFAGGAVLAAAGLALILAIPSPALVLAGLGVIGLGLANLIPLLYMGAARTAPAQPMQAIARVLRYATIGRVLDPLLIGVAAQALGLRGALSVVVVMASVAAVLGYFVLRDAGDRPDLK